MARIRTIKPEFFTSEQVVECSTSARLLFVGLWCFSDDAGRHVASTMRLKMEVYPGDTFSNEEIQKMISELKDAGLIIEYSSQGKSYWQVTGWQHQKIDKPTVRYPAPKFDDHSTSTSRPFDEPSGTEWKGMEGKGCFPPKSPQGDFSDANGEEPKRKPVRQQGGAK